MINLLKTLGILLILGVFLCSCGKPDAPTGTVWNPETSRVVCEPCQTVRTGKCVWCYELGQECKDGTCIQSDTDARNEKILTALRDSESAPQGCQKCQKLVNGKCTWCYELGEECENGDCIKSVVSCGSCERFKNGKCVRCSDLGEDCKNGKCTPQVSGSDQRIIPDDFSHMINKDGSIKGSPRDCDVCDGLIIRDRIPDVTIVSESWSRSGSSSSSHSSSSSSSHSGATSGVTDRLKTTRNNIININNTVNNNKIDIKRIDQRIALIKNSKKKTETLVLTQQKLEQLKTDREAALRKLLRDKHTELAKYKEIANFIEEHPAILVKEKERKEKAKREQERQAKIQREKEEQLRKAMEEHKRQQKEVNMRNEAERKQRELEEHQRKQEAFNKQKEAQRRQTEQEEHKRQQEAFNRQKEQEPLNKEREGQISREQPTAPSVSGGLSDPPGAFGPSQQNQLADCRFPCHDWCCPNEQGCRECIRAVTANKESCFRSWRCRRR